MWSTAVFTNVCTVHSLSVSLCSSFPLFHPSPLTSDRWRLQQLLSDKREEDEEEEVEEDRFVPVSLSFPSLPSVITHNPLCFISACNLYTLIVSQQVVSSLGELPTKCLYFICVQKKKCFQSLFCFLNPPLITGCISQDLVRAYPGDISPNKVYL